ncbi:hypothetical protein BESB_009490 [Besnoitia besnoiti]|uniref:Transmembrane protein n=1 Tax=Besnoitia besnoiti TaxID=94643 RepID=A0A2A9MQN7_BESBE|nr:hypothetical protein BESB_009490 [Besnoitia besnoiti]PFH38607.1 hypothetical protein BESB_009490 [Besnoitia besnoiti]
MMSSVPLPPSQAACGRTRCGTSAALFGSKSSAFDPEDTSSVARTAAQWQLHARSAIFPASVSPIPSQTPRILTPGSSFCVPFGVAPLRGSPQPSRPRGACLLSTPPPLTFRSLVILFSALCLRGSLGFTFFEGSAPLGQGAEPGDRHRSLVYAGASAPADPALQPPRGNGTPYDPLDPLGSNGRDPGGAGVVASSAGGARALEAAPSSDVKATPGAPDSARPIFLHEPGPWQVRSMPPAPSSSAEPQIPSASTTVSLSSQSPQMRPRPLAPVHTLHPSSTAGVSALSSSAALSVERPFRASVSPPFSPSFESPCEFSSSAAALSFVESEAALRGHQSVPRVCAFARCKSGGFTPRPVNDPNKCFTFSECSQCPLHSENQESLCVQVEDRKGLLLLMKSALTFSPSPSAPFHYKPISAKEIERLNSSRNRPTGGPRGGGGDADGDADDDFGGGDTDGDADDDFGGGDTDGYEGSARGSRGGGFDRGEYNGDGEGYDEWSSGNHTFLQMQAREKRPARTSKTGEALRSSHEGEISMQQPSSFLQEDREGEASGDPEQRNGAGPAVGRTAGLRSGRQTEPVEAKEESMGNSAPLSAAAAPPFAPPAGATSSRLSADASPTSFLRLGERAWSDEYGDPGDDSGDYDQASMVGDYGEDDEDDGGGSAHSADGGGAEAGHGGGVRVNAGKAIFLKFDESRVFRIVPSALLGDVGRCATDSKNYMRLQVVVLMQPRRFRMSVPQAKKMMGLKAPRPAPPPPGRDEEFADEMGRGGAEDDRYDDGYDRDSFRGGSFIQLAQRGAGDAERAEAEDTGEGKRLREAAAGEAETGEVFENEFFILPDSEDSPAEERSADDARNGGELEHAHAFAEEALDLTTPAASLDLHGGVAGAGLSFLQGKGYDDDDYGDDGGDYGEEAGGGKGVGAKMKQFFGGLFKRKKSEGEEEKEDKDIRDEEYDDEDNPPDHEGEPAPKQKAGKRGPRILSSMAKLFQGKSPEEKKYLKETKQAKKRIKKISRVGVEFAFSSPAVKKCSRPLSWTGSFPATKILHSSFFIMARQSEVGAKLAAFINTGFTVTLKCKSKGGCMMNEVPLSCATVTCVKAKHISKEALEEEKKRASNLADHNLKMAQQAGAAMSEEERAERAAEYARKIKEKQQEIETGQLSQQQLLTAQEQQAQLQQQLASLSSGNAPLDANQAKLLAALQGDGGSPGGSNLGVTMQEAPASATNASAMHMMQNMVALDRPTGYGGSTKMGTGAILALVSLCGLAAVFVGVVTWRCLGNGRSGRRRGRGRR